MHKDNMNDDQIHGQEDIEVRDDEEVQAQPADEKERSGSELEEANNKYLRLYAEFENYKKRVNKDKEELVKYGNESLLYELLPVIDNLELALKHASSDDISSGLIEGVEITRKELVKILEKFGVSAIEAEGKPFDPSVHHAMTQVERDDINENIVVDEFRKGYTLRDKVLRPSLVSVSKRIDQNQVNEDESNQDDKRIKIKIKEES